MHVTLKYVLLPNQYDHALAIQDISGLQWLTFCVSVDMISYEQTVHHSSYILNDMTLLDGVQLSEVSMWKTKNVL